MLTTECFILCAKVLTIDAYRAVGLAVVVTLLRMHYVYCLQHSCLGNPGDGHGFLCSLFKKLPK